MNVRPRKEEKEYGLSSQSLFASSHQPAVPLVDDTVWQRTVYADENTVLQMIQAAPALVEEKGAGICYSRKRIESVTPYQAALIEGDDLLAGKIMDIYLQHNSEDGQAVLDAQFAEVFPEGYKVHLEAQKTAANKFARDFINPLIDTMINTHPAGISVALDKQFDNDSKLCNQLNAFRTAFDALSHQEKVFNPFHLVNALEKYNEKIKELIIDTVPPYRWLRLNLFWCQIIGFEQRYLPANYAQLFCAGMVSLIDNKSFKRTFTLKDYDKTGVTRFYPIVCPQGPHSGLGFDFACHGYYGAAVGRINASYTVLQHTRDFKNHVTQKQRNAAYMYTGVDESKSLADRWCMML